VPSPDVHGALSRVYISPVARPWHRHGWEGRRVLDYDARGAWHGEVDTDLLSVVRRQLTLSLSLSLSLSRSLSLSC